MNYRVLSIIIGAGLVASPAAANPFDLGGAESEVGVFAGGSVRLALGQSRRQPPQARLQLSGTQVHGRPGSAPRFPLHGKGLELELSSSKPSFLIGGHKLRPLGPKLGIDGNSTPLLVVGGLVAAGGLLFLAAEIFDNNTNAEPCTPGNC